LEKARSSEQRSGRDQGTWKMKERKARALVRKVKEELMGGGEGG
jgi:hypothetical protein